MGVAFSGLIVYCKKVNSQGRRRDLYDSAPDRFGVHYVRPLYAAIENSDSMEFFRFYDLAWVPLVSVCAGGSFRQA